MKKNVSAGKLFGLGAGLLLTMAAGLASHAGTLVQFRTTSKPLLNQPRNHDRPDCVRIPSPHFTLQGLDDSPLLGSEGHQNTLRRGQDIT